MSTPLEYLNVEVSNRYSIVVVCTRCQTVLNWASWMTLNDLLAVGNEHTCEAEPEHDTVREVLARLKKARTELLLLSGQKFMDSKEYMRIRGKAEGVQLAISYIEEEKRIHG